MHVSDMTEQTRQTLPRGVIFTKHPSHPIMMILMISYCLRLQIGGIDTPSDEFYTINTNQSSPHMSARHKLQPRLLRSNPNTKQKTCPKKPTRQKWTGPIYLPGHIYKL